MREKMWKEFWPKDVRLREVKKGFIYLLTIFICFMVLAIAGFLLEITGQYQNSYQDKWDFFQEDLKVESMTYLWTGKDHLKDLENAYRASRRLVYEQNQVTDGLEINFQTRNKWDYSDDYVVYCRAFFYFCKNLGHKSNYKPAHQSAENRIYSYAH